MPRSPLNYGAAPNDGTGDTIRQAATKIDNALQEIYQRLGDGTNFYSRTVADATQVPDVNASAPGRLIQTEDDRRLHRDDGQQWRTILDNSGSVGELSDVDLTTAAPTADQTLAWDVPSGSFKPLSGLVLTSPNGTRFQLGVDDSGNLTTTQL